MYRPSAEGLTQALSAPSYTHTRVRTHYKNRKPRAQKAQKAQKGARNDATRSWAGSTCNDPNGGVYAPQQAKLLHAQPRRRNKAARRNAIRVHAMMQNTARDTPCTNATRRHRGRAEQKAQEGHKVRNSGRLGLSRVITRPPRPSD